MNVILFVKIVNNMPHLLRIKKEEDEFWSYFPINKTNILEEHPSYMYHHVDDKKIKKGTRRLKMKLEEEQVSNYFDTVKNEFKFGIYPLVRCEYSF